MISLTKKQLEEILKDSTIKKDSIINIHENGVYQVWNTLTPEEAKRFNEKSTLIKETKHTTNYGEQK